MRAARLHAVGDLRVSEEPGPESGSGMSLVRVTAVGICGSDLHWWDEGAIGDDAMTHPLVPGHEGAGWSPKGRGVVDLASLVTRRAGLGEAADAFGDAARRTGLKVIIEPQR